jgi:AraC family L-rhamnose operon regulatory protein RhaS
MTQPKRHEPVQVHLPPYGVYLLESHHAPEFRMGEQSHPFLELFFVLSGSGTFLIDGAAHACRRNDLVVVPPGRRHVIRDDPARPLSLYAACVTTDLVRHDRGLFEQLPVGTVRLDKVRAAELRASFRRLLFEQTRQRPFGPTLVVGLTLQLLAGLARHASSDERRHVTERPAPAATRRAAVEKLVEALSYRFFERMSLDEAAAEVGLSRRRFTTLFAEITGNTWAEHLTRLRIDYARTLLEETAHSILSIAFECGYEDLSSFYRAFKRVTGRSPKQCCGGAKLPDLQKRTARLAKTPRSAGG